MKKFFTNKYFLSFIGILLFFLIWFILYFASGKSNSIFPDPLTTFKQMFVYLGDEYTYKCIAGSLSRMVAGFAVASLAGIIVGSFVGNFKNLKHVFNPTIIALKAIPTAALVFIFLQMAGLKNAPIYIVVLLVFPIVYEATISGFSNVDKSVIMASQVDGANRVKSTFKIKLPLATPYILLGLLVSFALSFKVEIMAEVVSGSSSYGIGRAIQLAYLNSSNGLVPTFAYSLIAIIIMLLVTLIVDILRTILKKRGY